ncbi:MAG: phosphonoacetaldehyde hydrolase [Oscillochloris sp.]|nr:phosphonoacetaldehyde hydrolase [Oscillochloris sp.]
MRAAESGAYRPAQLAALVLDWAGTTVDYGSRAPVAVFVEVFRRRGVEISIAQARAPMGLEKRDHIRAIAAEPEIAARWQAVHNRPWNEDDIAAMYADSLLLQISVVGDYGELTPGTPALLAACRERGLKIGSTTGYSRAIMERLAPVAAAQGYLPDTIICPEDVGAGRPAPFMIWRALMKLQVFPAAAALVVGDTVPDMLAGRYAGAWTVGLSMSGNEFGLHPDEIAVLKPEEIAQRTGRIAARMQAAGAHYVVNDLSELLPIIELIDQRLAAGDMP